jgi:hypothetical protein
MRENDLNPDRRELPVPEITPQGVSMNSVNASENLAEPLRNQRGGVIGIIIFLLALIGAWYMYQSYTRGQVKSNLKSITNDYEHGIKKIIPSGK